MGEAGRLLPLVIEQHAEEVPFLWLLRERRLRARDTTRGELLRIDDRMLVNLDGIRHAAGPGQAHQGASAAGSFWRSGRLTSWAVMRNQASFAPGDADLRCAEAAAREAKAGLWAHPSPVAPWDWRKGVGVPVTARVVGNLRSGLYHSPNCRGVSRMNEANRVVFATAAEAAKAGYRKAGDCGR